MSGHERCEDLVKASSRAEGKRSAAERATQKPAQRDKRPECGNVSVSERSWCVGIKPVIGLVLLSRRSRLEPQKHAGETLGNQRRTGRSFCQKSLALKTLLLCEVKKEAYIGDVRLQVHYSSHFIFDTRFVDGQSPVRADQLCQVNHELLICPTCLSNTQSFTMILSVIYCSRKKKGGHKFEFNQ